MFPFTKKKKEERPEGTIPLERIQNMAQSGMSDRDIMRRLKAEGYSYEQIERAMLGAVKQGVAPVEPSPAPHRTSELPTLDDIYAAEPRRPGPADISDLLEPELEGAEPIPPEELSPELAIEELIEGTVDEKMQSIEDKIEKLQEEQHRIRVLLKRLKERAEKTTETPAPDISEFREKLTDLEARVGGLERAFKQFLPGLTHNVESLSKMIHELKEKGIREPEES
jgi:DNA-binding transcriptional MerR regulator